MSGPIKTETVYRCGRCKGQHETEAKALACCICKCGAPVRKGYGWRAEECEACHLREVLRTRRRELTKKKDAIVEDERAIAQMQVDLDVLRAKRAASEAPT